MLPILPNISVLGGVSTTPTAAYVSSAEALPAYSTADEATPTYLSGGEATPAYLTEVSS